MIDETVKEIIRLDERVSNVESYLTEHKGNISSMQVALAELNTTLVLLKSVVENLDERTKSKDKLTRQIYLYAVGAIIAAAIGWIVAGGMAVSLE